MKMNKYEITYNKPGEINAKIKLEAPDRNTALTVFYLSRNTEVDVVSVKNLSDGSSWEPQTEEDLKNGS